MVDSRHFIAALVCSIAALAVLVGPASARQSVHENWHDEGTLIHENFCGAAGLTVSDEFVADGKITVVPHGSDGPEYFLNRYKETNVVTNLANGKVIGFSFTVAEKDLKVTENGEGTVTVLFLSTGNLVLYGADGKAIARNPGQVRIESVFDEDGELISERLVKGSTGRSDDICAAAVEALT